MAAEETWVKTMPSAIAEGLTGGRSDAFVVSLQHIGAEVQHDDVIDGGKRERTRHTVEGGHCDACCVVDWMCGLVVGAS